MSGASLPAARKGDRIAHSAGIDSADSEALLGVTLGALASSANCGGALSASVGGGVSPGGGGKMKGTANADPRPTLKIETRKVTPHSTTGEIEEGSPDTFIGGPSFAAALAGAQKVDCHHHRDKPIRKGSATVFVNKLRLSRASDETACGAILCDGAPTVLVGGASVDDAPPDPLALVSRGAALASAAVGAAITAGSAAVTNAIRYGEGLVDGVLDEVDTALGKVEKGVAQADAAVSAKVGELAGEIKGGALGSLLGALLGDPNAK